MPQIVNVTGGGKTTAFPDLVTCISLSRMAGFTLVVFCLLAFSEATVFLVEPHNQTVEVGGQATFRCNFKQDYDCVKIYWLFSNSHCSEGSFSTFANCRSLLPNPLLIDGSRLVSTFGHSTYQVQFKDVRPSDAGYYACWDSVGDEYSRCGHLKVVDPPIPLCTMLSLSVRVGESVSLKCQVPEDALARTKLTWHPQKSGSTRSLKLNPGESYTIQRVVQESDILGFTCIAGNEIKNGPNCTISLFHINTVHVIQLDYSRDEPFLKLECVADVVLPDTHYLWSVRGAAFPNGTLPDWMDVSKYSRLDAAYDQTRFLIVKPTEDDDGLQVRCTVYSDNGMTKTSEAVTIIRCPDGHFGTNSISDCDEDSLQLPSHIWLRTVAPVFAVLVIFFLIIVLRKKLPSRRTNDKHVVPMTTMNAAPRQTDSASLAALSDDDTDFTGWLRGVPSPISRQVGVNSSDQQSSSPSQLLPPKPPPYSHRRALCRAMTAPPLKNRRHNAPVNPDADTDQGASACECIDPVPKLPRANSTQTTTTKNHLDHVADSITIPEYLAVGGGLEPRETTPTYSVPNKNKKPINEPKKARLVQPYSCFVIENS